MTEQQTVINHKSVITDHLTHKDELYMRTICVFLQDDPHGWGYLTVCASCEDGVFTRQPSFSLTCNITTDRLPYLQEAIARASKWLTIEPSKWVEEGQKWNLELKTMGGKAAYDAANKLTEDYYGRSRKKRK